MKYQTIFIIFLSCGSSFLFLTYIFLYKNSTDHNFSSKVSAPATTVERNDPKLLINQQASVLLPPPQQDKPTNQISSSTLNNLLFQPIGDPSLPILLEESQPTPTVECLDELPVHLCPQSLEDRLNQPVLTPDQYQWCIDQLNPKIGGVIVGKSWGNLKTLEQRTKFEDLHCNAVNAGMNPSCSDAWGDSHLLNWRKKMIVNQTCSFKKFPLIQQLFSSLSSSAVRSSSSRPSSPQISSSDESTIQCYKNEIEDMYCSFTNVQINFHRFQKQTDGNGKSIRKFEKDFITIPCNEKHEEHGKAYEIPEFKLNHLISTTMTNPQCDAFIPGITLIYGHDNIKNLAHTMNDIMNVWLILWLEGLASQVHNVNFLTIDGLKAYHNFDDLINQFYFLYQLHFQSILRAMYFQQDKTHNKNKKIICFEKIITQSLPSRGFVWDHWHQDLPCSFLGPSSLFQRWNLQIRNTMGLFPFNITKPFQDCSALTPNKKKKKKASFKKITVLVIVRSEKQNEWGSYRTSRLYLNLPEMITMLQKIAIKYPTEHPSLSLPIEIVVKDLKDIPTYEAQLRLMSSVNILIGMHGAGISHSMAMPLGSDYCCGVIEIIPTGEFSPVRGFANMIRKMNFHYARIAINQENSLSSGARVPIPELEEQFIAMLQKIQTKPACVLPTVIKDPFFDQRKK